uniref:Uncharacterized protein n=1 Tax=Haptolina brevifila TaxID=156173 RepID=A0A7S2H321_9EUKA|mmetsp:Transcript_50741/g.100958  ORF Transcript_50741/g.100958 Transcript_50741/m.100958 type:complete len:252 (+) Transcript_50741:100-855(+)|eukprot:CAMPEP_0174736860 /NCGR_PEP_ID=MMETSP1094-20130205/67380_1 /TAXON_ID=156173 /ORGANISM="Chrysochromulina brevifilum, Strain UTEX LB 985" /LENGTH=251 /DNA_ID=CAMNT_0015940025 /DNA_START=94 /DNA_END=849 /DNA_ORIENTATION=+
MLSADKTLLDAQLRNELQQLRKTEIENVVCRFQNALVPATLIAGFSFEAMVMLEMTHDSDLVEPQSSSVALGEQMFYLFTATALALALLVTVVSCMGVLFGLRLMVQANADQGSRHEELVGVLNFNVLVVLITLSISMICVIIAAGSVVWVKVPSEDTRSHSHVTSWVSMASVIVITLLTAYFGNQMFFRLFSYSAASANLSLHASKAAGPVPSCTASTKGQRVDEFFIAASPGMTGTGTAAWLGRGKYER